MLAPGLLGLLGAKHGESAGDAAAGGMRVDHLVDVAALGRHEGRQEPFLVFARALGDLLGVADVLPEDDLDRALGPITAICAVGQA